jgi:hypothetical protein
MSKGRLKTGVVAELEKQYVLSEMIFEKRLRDKILRAAGISLIEGLKAVYSLF